MKSLKEYKFITIDALSKAQRSQYTDAIEKAFPPIIGESQVIKTCWSKLESHYPEYQFLLTSGNAELVGFINTVPFRFDFDLEQLPDRGWDWMLTKEISDYENNIKPNYLGGLQVIVRKKFQKLGFSKVILNYIKDYNKASKFNNLLIPIRPTKKHEQPTVSMSDYLNLTNEKGVFDPWVRTHLNGGAEIIKVCEKSMTMKGDLRFWEGIMKENIRKSGKYNLEGALSLITIDFENDYGEYVEPNVWIKY